MWDAGFSCRRPTFCAFKRNRRASNSLSPVLIHFIAPHGKLYSRLLTLEQVLGSIPPIISEQQHPGPCEPHHSIPLEERPNVVRRVREQHESLRQVAAQYGVSHETIRRLLRTSDKESAGETALIPRCLSLGTSE